MVDERAAMTAGAIAYARTNNILSDVCSIIEQAQSVARRAVDVTFVHRNWLIGYRIAEEELAGESRALYGKETVAGLARDLTLRYGKGYTRRALYKYLQFYRTFPEIVPTVTAQSRPLLSWSHYEELMRVNEPQAREWYEREASAQTWSVRTLRRNINTQYYDRVVSNQLLGGEVPAALEDEALMTSCSRPNTSSTCLPTNSSVPKSKRRRSCSCYSTAGMAILPENYLKEHDTWL